MKLSEADSDLFFKLMWRLQIHVNRKRGLIPGVGSVEEYAKLPQSEVAKVRNALWDDPGQIDAYIAENPDGLPAEELAIVGKWKRFVSGAFYITRFLKKHTVFLSEGGKVYAVLSLREPLEDMLFGHPPPVMVRTVLLPFKGKIVYDGFLSTYNITFGGGIRRRMNETYRTAWERGLIVESLEPDEGPRPVRSRPEKPCRDWRPVLEDLVERAARLKGGPALQRAAFGVLQASAQLARDAAQEPVDPLALRQAEHRLRRAISRWRRTVERVTDS